MGPTATGKTELAVTLREVLPVDIISVDSALVYRGMDIGTAKPPLSLRARHPHALIDIIEPSAVFSAARFRDAAVALVRQSWRAGRIPLLVGGTMLYFKALLHGISALPPANPALRAAIGRQAAAAGWPAVHQRLAALDPEAAACIAPNDPQRLQRALEICELTGGTRRKAYEATRLPGLAEMTGARVLQVALQPTDRTLLHERIAMRLRAMLAGGLIEEVEALRRRPDLHAGLPAMRAVGYRQVWRWLDDGKRGGLASLEAQILAATRQLAKRQLTWLRRWPDAQRVDPYAPMLSPRVLQMTRALAIVK